MRYIFIFLLIPVKGNWNEWSQWTSCNATICGNGYQERERTCNYDIFGNDDCTESGKSDLRFQKDLRFFCIFEILFDFQRMQHTSKKVQARVGRMG